MMKKLASSAMAALALLAACAAPEKAPPPRPPAIVIAPPPPTEADQLVARLARLNAAGPAEQQAEVARLKESNARNPSDVGRVELAFALTAAGADEGEILAALEPVTREGGTASVDVKSVAGFLQGVILERRKLKESLAAATARASADRKSVEASRQKEAQLQEQISRLQKKLDALMNLEKSLSDRKNAR
jgi:hypothetical protein